MRRLGQSCVSAILATSFGLVCAQLLGFFWWPPGAVLTLIAIGLLAAGWLARLMAVRWGRPSSVIASAVGSMVACYFAVAAAEVLGAGSFRWAFEGGLYGACFGLPVAALLSPLGLIENLRRKRAVRSTTKDSDA